VGAEAPSAGPSAGEMWRTLKLAFAHRREPLAYGRAVSGLTLRDLRRRGIDPRGRRWLDVGTGSGTLPEALGGAGAGVVALDLEDRRADGVGRTEFVLARGESLPFGAGVFDAVSCSNVLEHTPDTWGLIRELLRVCRPEAVVYLSWTNWYSPFGGHEWSPLHYLGPRLGPRVYSALSGHPPRNRPGRTLFAVHVGMVLDGLRGWGIEVLDVTPRYWPRQRWMARVPGLREVLMWNCVILLRAPAVAAGVGRDDGLDPASRPASRGGAARR